MSDSSFGGPKPPSSRSGMRSEYVNSCRSVGMLEVEVPVDTFAVAELLGLVDSYSELRWRILRVGDDDRFQNYKRVIGVSFLQFLPWEHIEELNVTYRRSKVDRSKRLQHERRPAFDYERKSIKIWRQGYLKPEKLCCYDQVMKLFYYYVVELSKMADEMGTWQMTFEEFITNFEDPVMEKDVLYGPMGGMFSFHDSKLRNTWPETFFGEGGIVGRRLLM